MCNIVFCMSNFFYLVYALDRLKFPGNFPTSKPPGRIWEDRGLRAQWTWAQETENLAGGGQWFESVADLGQKTWQGADRGLKAQWTRAQETEDLAGWQGAGGAVDMSPGDWKPRRGLTGGWGAHWTWAQETEDLAGGGQGAEGTVDVSPGDRRTGGRGRTGGAVDMSQEGGRRLRAPWTWAQVSEDLELL